MTTDPIQSLEAIQDILVAVKSEFSNTPIPKLKEAVDKLAKLVEFSQRSKGNEDVVRQLSELIALLNKTTLTPILEAQRASSFSVSGDLANNLYTLFNGIDTSVPSINRSSSTGRLRGWKDADSTMATVITNIESALSTFLQQGKIERTDQGQLIQRKPIANVEDSAARSRTRQSQPQVQRALIKHSRFRVLLLGKTGAGKSSLINHVFKVNSAEVVHYHTGRADINQEHTSESNPHFILHDSMGFETGSQKQYNLVEDFIKERSGKKELSDRLHAIWLCIAIPSAGGRLFEIGDEQIFKLNLHNVPLVVVFTQYDILVTRVAMEQTTLKAGLDSVQVRKKTDDYFQGLCTSPLKQTCTGDVLRETPPYATVSVKRGFGDTISELMRLTASLLPTGTLGEVPHDTESQPTRHSNERRHGPENYSTSNTGRRRNQPNTHSTAGGAFAIAQESMPPPTSKL